MNRPPRRIVHMLPALMAVSGDVAAEMRFLSFKAVADIVCTLLTDSRCPRDCGARCLPLCSSARTA
jgi:hypothetical protein